MEGYKNIMEIYIGQIYIEANVNFCFSHVFQNYLHTFLSENIITNKPFEEKYQNYNFMFRMSAKKGLTQNEIKGPTIYKKDKDIEYSIFLPFDIIMKNKNYNYVALKYLFNGLYTIFEDYKLDFSKIKDQEENEIGKILNNENMFYNKDK
jgi:hypothetical protein